MISGHDPGVGPTRRDAILGAAAAGLLPTAIPGQTSTPSRRVLWAACKAAGIRVPAVDPFVQWVPCSLPGDGELPIAKVVGQLKAIGTWTSVGPEVFADAMDALSATEAGAAAGASLARFL